MKTGTSMAEILELSVPERIQLVEEIWDSLAAIPQSISLTEDQKDELEKRLSAYRFNPRQGSPWNLVKKRIRKKS